MRNWYVEWRGRDRNKDVASSKRLRDRAIPPAIEKPDIEEGFITGHPIYPYGQLPPVEKAKRSFNAKSRRHQKKPNIEGLTRRDKHVARHQALGKVRQERERYDALVQDCHRLIEDMPRVAADNAKRRDEWRQLEATMAADKRQSWAEDAQRRSLER